MIAKSLAQIRADLARSRAFAMLDNRNAALDFGRDEDAQSWYAQYRDAGRDAHRWQALADGPIWHRWFA